jgi:DNA (cytosine-5)-methyltransferase 1
VAENVFGLLSSDNGLFFGNILNNLASIGYDAEWQVLPAQKFGAPHRRERIYIVAYPDGLGREIFNFKESRRSLSRYRLDNSKQIWGNTKPSNIRMDNGVPIELDKLRVKQMGNAVVPQILEWIGKRIMEVENDR